MAPDTMAKSPRSGGLSLYADLLDPSSNKDPTPSTISRAPVVFKQPAGEDAQLDRGVGEKQQQISAASLRFQPTKRPQLAAQKPKTKASLHKPSSPAPASVLDQSDHLNPTARPPAKSTLADWTADGDENDVNGFYGTEKRQRGGRKRRKKTKEESHIPQNWDDIYDPSRPNNYEDYKHSDEKILELREWKDRLYAHRSAKRRESTSDGSEDNYKPGSSSVPLLTTPPVHPDILIEQLPPGMSFAPPVFDDSGITEHVSHTDNTSNDPTGKDAYARRKLLSGLGAETTIPVPPPATRQSISASPPPPPPPAPGLPEAIKPANPPSSISRAPVRYAFPVAPSEIPATEAELESALERDGIEEESTSDAAPRSLRPGQKGFAERLMSRYGWSKGSGLGASGSGIVNPLRVQIEKQKKKPDSEGGGFAGPGGRGKIVGGKKKGGSAAEVQEGKFGAMSTVVVLRGMVEGMDLDAEMEGSGQGGLMQEIGEECGGKYGRVERVFIDRNNNPNAKVFVQFTSQLSALRAVNALEGRIFNGNTIVARFFDSEKFESGTYE